MYAMGIPLTAHIDPWRYCTLPAPATGVTSYSGLYILLAALLTFLSNFLSTLFDYASRSDVVASLPWIDLSVTANTHTHLCVCVCGGSLSSQTTTFPPAPPRGHEVLRALTLGTLGLFSRTAWVNTTTTTICRHTGNTLGTSTDFTRFFGHPSTDFQKILVATLPSPDKWGGLLG